MINAEIDLNRFNQLKKMMEFIKKKVVHAETFEGMHEYWVTHINGLECCLYRNNIAKLYFYRET